MKLISLTFVAVLAISSTSYAAGVGGPVTVEEPEAITVVTTEFHHHADGTKGIRQKTHHFGPKNHASNKDAEDVSLGLFSSAKDLLGKAGHKIKEVGGKAIDVAKDVGGKAVEVGKSVGGAALSVAGAAGSAAISFVEANQDTIKDIASKGLQIAVKEGAGLAGAALTGGKEGAKTHVKSRISDVASGGKKK